MGMMPVYRYMDPSPHQRSQMPFPQYYFPGVEAAPPQMVMDPSQSEVRYEAWPHGGNYGGYGVPSHGCCSHGSFPGYHGFRPPYGYFVPAPPFHQYGSYNSFPEAYPMYYAPPPHYSMELPSYEYDKDAARSHHCCACPNHPGHLKNDRGVKIEEHEPDVKKSEGDAVVPAQFRNYPYPILRIPHDNKPFESEGDGWDKKNDDRRAKQVVKSPEVWNGWFPLNMNGNKSDVQEGDGRKLKSKQNEDKTRHFPFPFIWIPYEQQEADENQNNRKSVPSSKPAQVTEKSGATVENQPKDDVEIMRQEKDQECTRVQQADVQKMDNSEEMERKGIGVPVKQAEDGTKEKTSGTGTKRQSSSPPKSKLPPVCLRVDPLPKKRNGNGSSSSPSPPSLKGKATETLKENSMPSAEKVLKESSTKEKQPEVRSPPSKTNQVQPKMKQIKDVPVIEKRSEENDVEISPFKPVDSQEEACRKPAEKIEGAECLNEEVAKHEETSRPEVAPVKKQANDPVRSSSGECEAEKKQLSEVEAALLIQSAYRGYEVRKWESLKKLKQITKVREKVAEVRNQIQALESSSDLQKDDKQKLVIGEKIMDLLLKLDTIQGLHPSLRDNRKALARELVALQEKLDSLTSKHTMEEAAKSKLADSLNVDSQNDLSMPVMHNKGTFEVDESHTEYACDSGEIAKQPGEELLSHAISNVATESTSEETVEPIVVQHVQHESDAEHDNTGSCQVANTQSSLELGGEIHGDNPPAMVEIQDEPSTLQQSVDLSLVPENKFSLDHSMGNNEIRVETTEKEKTQEAGVNDVGAPHVTEEPEGDKLSLFQQESAQSESQKQIGEEEKEKEHGTTETDSATSSALPVRIENSMPTVEARENVIEGELPVGVIEDEEAIPQPEEHTEPMKSTEGENNVTRNSSSSIGDVSVVSESEELLREADSGEWIKVLAEQPLEEDEFKVVHKPDEVPSGEESAYNIREADGDYRTIHVDALPSSDSENQNTLNQEKEMMFEEKKVDQEMISIDTTVKETSGNQTPELETRAENAQHPNESAEFEVPAETHRPSEEAKQLVESSLSPISSKDEDMKLLEENKLLRAMMKKLMEAGNEQLTAISNLTGRVKDIERKLYTKKKTRKPGYKKPKCAPSWKKPANPSSS